MFSNRARRPFGFLQRRGHIGLLELFAIAPDWPGITMSLPPRNSTIAIIP
jgi:hypothetical protein